MSDQSHSNETTVLQRGTCAKFGGCENGVNDRTWSYQFERLAIFKALFFHTQIPENYPLSNPSTLAIWANEQRQEMKKLESGEPSTLSDERKRMLDELGFEWHSYSANDGKESIDTTGEPASNPLRMTSTVNSHINTNGSFLFNKENHSMKTYGRWKQEEHRQFLRGIAEYGKGRWKKISILVQTRTPTQVRTHAQKYFKNAKIP